LFIGVILLLQNEESGTESRSEKQKNDDPVVDLFPDEDADERNSKLKCILFIFHFMLFTVMFADY